MDKLSITWFGHSTFLLRTPGGKRVLFDPWFTSNPSCPEALKKPPKADLILVSHGHFDHIEDLLLCARDSGAPVVAIFELCDWLGRKGIQNTSPMNKGGSQTIAGLRVTMTDARHSSGLRRQRRRWSTWASRPATSHARGRPRDLLRGRYVPVRRHAVDRRDVQAGDRVPADRRPVHDGSGRRGEGLRVPRRQAGRADALGNVPAADRHARGTQDAGPAWRRRARAASPERRRE